MSPSYYHSYNVAYQQQQIYRQNSGNHSKYYSNQYEYGNYGNQYYHQRSLNRLGQIQAQHELARNFYDDFEFCPIQCSDEVYEHYERIQQRHSSPESSPSTSPSMSTISSLSSSPTNKKKRIIPIINPTNMTPVNITK